MFIAENIDRFRAHFVQRLHDLLDSGELGAFILVLANSMQDAETRAQLDAKLRQVFTQHCEAWQAGELQAAPDDMQVFGQLMESGIDDYSAWRICHKPPWLQFYNPLRALRPARASAETVSGLNKPFNPDGFHFNKPFLRAEQLWQGELATDTQRIGLTVFYNKFPFMPYHFILAPEAGACMPQYLQPDYHEMIWTLCMQQAASLPGLGVGYNSIGACASVNHLHFQGFIHTDLLPVESPQWQHQGGDSPYPMPCTVFEDVDSAWQAIHLLHQQNQPYNLLYRPGRCYVLRRKMQGDPAVRPRVQGAGWIEAVGVFAEADSQAIEQLDAAQLQADIHSLAATTVNAG